MKLICEQITKRYKDKVALDQVSLTLEQGKIYGLIGRNGAGKTTLLSIPHRPEPRHQRHGHPGWHAGVGGPEGPGTPVLLPGAEYLQRERLGSMKVKEYLRIASIYYPHWDAAMAEKLVQLFELPLKKRMNKLSKGMLSMVTIIVALSSKAEFTLLDEPVAGLDVVAREQFYKLLLEEYTETGRTFVISTHIIEEAADVLEEVIILKDGKVLLESETQALVDSARYISGRAEDVDAATAVWRSTARRSPAGPRASPCC